MPNEIGVLYIDDSPAYLQAVSSFLNGKGYPTQSASNLEEALSCLQKQSSDIIIIDYLMPEHDGFAVLSEMRKSGLLPKNALFFLYTTDKNAPLDYAKHGFHGAFMFKGNLESFWQQFEPLGRLTTLRKLNQRPKG
jgi:CheY-like chemotaxis protein